MPKSIEEKVFRYVRDGRLKRLRSLLKRHDSSDINLNEITDNKKRTPLHIACLLGEDAIAGVLLDQGASVWATDEDLNTPLHLALRYALQVLEKRVIVELISPLFRQGKDVVDFENGLGEKPRDMLTQLKLELKRKEEDRRVYEEEEERKIAEKQRIRDEEKNWNTKLFDELQYDDVSSHHDAFGVDDDKSEHRQESYDEWAKRILREKREKYFASRPKPHIDSKREEIELRENEARERTKKLEEEHQAYIRKVSEKRLQKKTVHLKSDYEIRCDKVFNEKSDSKLRFDDIPWPCEGTAEEMLKLLSQFLKLSSDQKKSLREQQIRWHPDRFLQRCGERLDVEERDKVIEYVVEISQGINGLIENES